MSDQDEPGPIAEYTVQEEPPRRRRRREKHTLVSMGDYSLTKKGISRFDWADPYRMAVELSWPRFLATLFVVYVSVIGLFALAYTAMPGAIANARPYVFSDSFFFSLETLATVGYGYFYPATLYGHLMSSAEIMTGLVFTAILTGLVFVRFSKPRAKFVFATNPVITTHNGKPTLMLRVGNGRANVLADAKVKIGALISEHSKEGARFRRTHELSLVRHSLPVFPLTWTIMHEIDARSPLRDMSEAGYLEADVRLFVTFEARDPTLAQVVHDLRTYAPEHVRFGHHYVDVIGLDEVGRPCADMTKISDVEADLVA